MDTGIDKQTRRYLEYMQQKKRDEKKHETKPYKKINDKKKTT